ncbi:uncharacterized protein LOC142234845 [Haematobia irritans]|uniref:uncharacterized protein LOC142234845 n=1 Tax=Haematobia irritans TaxID=7368 RepID=UPI003F500913
MDNISVTGFIKTCPEYRQLYKNMTWNKEHVSNSYNYDDSIHENDLYRYYGIFMGLFIRKCLCRRFNIVCEDERVSDLLESDDPIENYYVRRDLPTAYAVYTDHNYRPIDIIDEIKNVALGHSLNNYDDDDISNIYDMDVNFSNLRDIVKFLNRLPYGSFQYKPSLELDLGDFTIEGQVDFIFDDYVFCQVATSMYDDAYKRKYAQVLIYVLCDYGENYYEDEEEQEYTIMIYNPLLGMTYSTEVLITPEYYEEMVEDITNDVYELYDE